MGTLGAVGVGLAAIVPFAIFVGKQLTARVVWQEAVVPPFTPIQLHVQGPVPVTTVGVPVTQRSIEGAIARDCPLELPQTPSTFLFALQFAVVPPFAPRQLHVQGPVPATVVAVPAVQRFVEGVVGKD
jgi:hypothetical protein